MKLEIFKFGGGISHICGWCGYYSLPKTQEELQDMVNRLVETGRKYGMEINIDKSQVMRVSRSNESLQIKVNNRELKWVDHFKYIGRVLTSDGYSKREIFSHSYWRPPLKLTPWLMEPGSSKAYSQGLSNNLCSELNHPNISY